MSTGYGCFVEGDKVFIVTLRPTITPLSLVLDIDSERKTRTKCLHPLSNPLLPRPSSSSSHSKFTRTSLGSPDTRLYQSHLPPSRSKPTSALRRPSGLYPDNVISESTNSISDLMESFLRFDDDSDLDSDSGSDNYHAQRYTFIPGPSLRCTISTVRLLEEGPIVRVWGWVLWVEVWLLRMRDVLEGSEPLCLRIEGNSPFYSSISERARATPERWDFITGSRFRVFGGLWLVIFIHCIVTAM
ncbi:hypothetical protein JAAARDRAFT_190721 [Jaapia argillacea MUCL 33604]|uniref:Uncharacterized protein n=1 Tax=Jaapia argillacea MUCL 33604 TaxID=933084 RepID=A0A067Q781_9AGAM|nr:hypothetical protein JAAARDRAFT_190721 [Jaapia argillacea MUCL 33604]